MVPLFLSIRNQLIIDWKINIKEIQMLQNLVQKMYLNQTNPLL